MTRYSHRDRILVKGNRFLSFTKNVGNNIGKIISRNLSCRYNPSLLAMHQKLLDHGKKSALKTSSKILIQKTAEATGNLVCTKIANKIIKVSKNSQ